MEVILYGDEIPILHRGIYDKSIIRVLVWFDADNFRRVCLKALIRVNNESSMAVNFPRPTIGNLVSTGISH